MAPAYRRAFRALENRERVDRGAGSSRDPERRGDEQERPASLLLTGREQLLEAQVVEQPDSHRIEREDVNRELDAFGVAGSRVAVPVRAEDGEIGRASCRERG